MINKEEVLNGIGLSKNEIKVYLTLLRLGAVSAGKITEHSGIHRRNVYDSIERLSKRGLVGEVTRNNVKIFEAADPSELLNLIKEEQEKLKDKEDGLKSILPELLSSRNFAVVKEDIRIYRGRKSRRIIFEDILRSAKENLVLGAHRPSKFSEIYLRNWHKKRIKAGVVDKLIYDEPCAFAKELAKLPLTKIKFLPKKIHMNNAINIYGNKVAMLLWSNNQPVAVLIDNEKVADDFRNHFRLLWKISK